MQLLVAAMCLAMAVLVLATTVKETMSYGLGVTTEAVSFIAVFF